MLGAMRQHLEVGPRHLWCTKHGPVGCRQIVDRRHRPQQRSRPQRLGRQRHGVGGKPAGPEDPVARPVEDRHVVVVPGVFQAGRRHRGGLRVDETGNGGPACDQSGMRIGMHQPIARLGRRLRPVRRCRHHVDDMVAARLQFAQQGRQHRRGAALDIMQQQDAFALGLDPGEGEMQHLGRRDMAPVVGRKISAPGHDAPGGEILLDTFGAQQPGNAEERRHRAGIAQRGGGVVDAVIDLLHRPFDRHPVEAEWMVFAVRSDGVTGLAEAADAIRKLVRHPADDEERRLDAFGGQRLQHLIAVRRQRTIVEGEHDLVVFERQGLAVLHGADLGVLRRVDHQRARGTERIGIAGATVGAGRGQGRRQKGG